MATRNTFITKLKLPAKIALSALLMYFIFSKIGFSSLASTLLKTNLSLFAMSLVLILPTIILMFLRWEFLLAVFHKESNFIELVRVYWIGFFFNLFLPSSMGGDAVKIYKLAKIHGKTIGITASVIMDRIIGLSSLTLLGSIFMFYGQDVLDVRSSTNIFFLLYFAFFVFFFIIFNINAIRRLTFLRNILVRIKLYDVVKEVYLSFNIYGRNKKALINSMAISLFSNLLMSIHLYLLAQSIGINISMIYFFILMPIIFLLSSLPVSIGGLGIQDGAYIYFLGQLGISPAASFSFSLLAHFGQYLTGLIGGIIYILENGMPKKNISKRPIYP